MKKKRILLLWNTIYSGNMGVNALTYSIISILEEISDNINIKFEYTLIGTGKSGINKGNLVINNKNINFLFYPAGISSSKKGILKHYIRILLKSDYVMDIGEGDSFTDIYGQGRFNVQYKSKIIVLFLFKRLVLLPQTIGPFKLNENENKAFFLLQHAKKIFVRDELTYKYLSKNTKLKKNIIKTVDVALFLPYDKLKKNTNRIQVGINVSALLWNGGYSRKNDFALKADYKELIREILNIFYDMENVELHLIPHVITSFKIEDDYEVSQLLKSEFNELILPEKFNDPVSAKSYISNLDFLIASRMHACIAAYSSQVPVYYMGYSRKFEGLFKHTLKYPFGVNLYEEDKDRIIEEINYYFSNRELLKKNIIDNKNNIDNYKKELSSILQEIII